MVRYRASNTFGDCPEMAFVAGATKITLAISKPAIAIQEIL